MISNEEMQILFEREGLDTFIQASFCNPIEGESAFEIYETRNGHLGVIFEIIAPPYPADETALILSTLLTANLPANSAVHFFKYASSNIGMFKERAEELYARHRDEAMEGIDNPEMIGIANKWQWDFIMSKTKESLLEGGINYHINNQINLVTILIPSRDEYGEFVSIDEARAVFTRCQSILNPFVPRFFRQEAYVSLMSEIFNGHVSPKIIRDNVTPLHDQIMDSGTTVRIMDSGQLQFGELKKFVSQIEEPPDKKKKKGLFSELFGAKKEERNEFVPRRYGSILVKRQFPHYLSLYEVSNIFMDHMALRSEPLIPENHFISLVVHIEDPDKKKEEIQAEAKWNKANLKNIGPVAEYNPALKGKAEEADIAIQMIGRGQIPMKAMWSMGVFSEDEFSLNKTVSSVISHFKKNSWELQEERLISLPVLLYSMPLQFDDIFAKFSQKFSTLYRANAAALAPVFADSKGFGAPAMTFVGRNGQIQGVDLFSSAVTVKNFMIVAPSGTGKSVLTQEFCRSYLSQGAYLRVVDRGNSYKRLVNIFGGEYVEFDENTCFNFFDGALTDENNELLDTELLRFVPIVGKMAGYDLNPDPDATGEEKAVKEVVSSYVAEALRNGYRMGGPDPMTPPGMREVLEALRHIYGIQREGAAENPNAVDTKLRDLIKALEPYGDPSGSYYFAFNGRSNVKFSKRFVAFEMNSLEPFGANFKSLVIMIIIGRISSEFFYMDRGIKKMLMIDEAWDLVSDPVAARFIDGASRTVRKHNAAIGAITNSLSDISKNGGTRVLYENSGWRIFFDQDPSSLNEAVSSGKLVVDEFQFDLISSLKTRPRVFSEVMFMTKRGSICVSRFFVSPPLYWLYTSDPNDLKVIQEIARKYNITEELASIAIASSMGAGEEEDFQVYVDRAMAAVNVLPEEEMAEELASLVT